MNFLACNLTVLSVIVVMDERLNFTSLAVAGTLKQIKAFVLDHMTTLVHVADLQSESLNIVEKKLRILQKKKSSHRPIGKLTVVDDRARNFGAIAISKCSTRECLRFDAFNLAFANRPDC